MISRQNTLEGASSYLQSNFIRPGVPHTERRLSEGHTALKNGERCKDELDQKPVRCCRALS